MREQRNVEDVFSIGVNIKMRRLDKYFSPITFSITIFFLLFSSTLVEGKIRKFEIDHLVIYYNEPQIAIEPPVNKGSIAQHSIHQVYLENVKHLEKMNSFRKEFLKYKGQSDGIKYSVSFRIGFTYSEKGKEKSLLFIDKKGNFEYHELEFGPAIKGKVPEALLNELVKYVEQFIGVIDFSLQRKKILGWRN